MSIETNRSGEPTGDRAPRPDASPTSGSAPLAKLGAGLAVVVALVFVARQLGDALPAAVQWVDALGPWGPLAFIAIYAIAVVAFVPGSILTLTGGALFGLAQGTALVFVAAVLGSGGAFLVARYLARGLVEQRLGRYPRFAAVDDAIADQGLKIVFLLRLSPAFPFSFMNYALELTRVHFRDYLLASFGMIPGTLLYVYYGKAAGDIAALAAGAAVDHDAGYYVVMGLGLLATIAVTTLVTRVARRALAESTRSDEDARSDEATRPSTHESGVDDEPR